MRNDRKTTKNEVLSLLEEDVFLTRAKIEERLKGRFTLQYVARLLGELVDEGKVERAGSTRAAAYRRKKGLTTYTRTVKNNDLQEHIIADDAIRELHLSDKLTEHVKNIFDFGFSEMLNNAIDHSRSEDISIKVTLGKKLTFTIRDFGIGAFRNVQKKRKLKSEFEAINDILKGKTTTAPRAHSGEGIFFTSKAVDVFRLRSFEFELLIDNTIPDVFVQKHPKKESIEGTEVTCIIDTKTDRHLGDVFRKFAIDTEGFGFNKTEIQIKLYQLGGVFVSRSQARRVTSGLDKFEKIVLDFADVPTVGQAFADEIFRVFQNRHPDIILEPINMNEAVSFMVQRVEGFGEQKQRLFSTT